jgi:hypothetical protein
VFGGRGGEARRPGRLVENTMLRVVASAFGAFLIVHGLIHLMGTTVYMKLGRIEGLPYKTSLLNGRWQLGEPGMRVFGALWALPAIGFVLAGVAAIVNVGPWPSLAGVAALVSLVLTILDFKAAFAGALLNLLIIVVVWAGLVEQVHRS